MLAGAAVGGQGMSDTDKKMCMVEDMEGLSPLAEAYARARGGNADPERIVKISISTVGEFKM